jgi:RNA polymerase sigma factor (sigma-70 family)
MADPITKQQIGEVEDRLRGLLFKKGFPREWIGQHVPDVMAHAQVDFAAVLENGPADHPMGLLFVIAYRRAIKVLRGELSKPTTSIENLFHLADESTPTPEEAAILHDRQEVILRAMSRLPKRDRELVALHYYEGLTVGAAGRQLGFGKTSAHRHYHAAMDKLKELLKKDLGS